MSEELMSRANLMALEFVRAAYPKLRHKDGFADLMECVQVAMNELTDQKTAAQWGCLSKCEGFLAVHFLGCVLILMRNQYEHENGNPEITSRIAELMKECGEQANVHGQGHNPHDRRTAAVN